MAGLHPSERIEGATSTEVIRQWKRRRETHERRMLMPNAAMLRGALERVLQAGGKERLIAE